jgi:shikimate kinase
MHRRFIVLSGLPGSGKSTLAQQLAPALDLPLIDKDTILPRLFESKGAGDAAQRRTLSRESDAIFQAEAAAAAKAVLVSHWHLPGMPVESGTPTGSGRSKSGSG